MRHGFRGYVTPRSFGEFSVPVPLQSLALRDYCKRNDMTFVLPVNEHNINNSYMVLEGLVTDLSSFEGVVMYSFRMLPEARSLRADIVEAVLNARCHFHFVLENRSIRNMDEFKVFEEIFAFERLSENSKSHLAQIQNLEI